MTYSVLLYKTKSSLQNWLKAFLAKGSFKTKMDKLTFCYAENKTLAFTPFVDEDGLPFPLFLSFQLRLAISISLLFSVFMGLKFRLIIFSFLRSPENALGPINYLIWVDEVNGLIYSVVVIARVALIHSQIPLSEILGKNFGQMIGFISCCYNAGSCIWSFLIALYRVIFIMAQSWLVKTLGAKMFVKVLVWLGALQVIILSYIFNEFDVQGSLTKSSFHLSTADMDILISYEVKYNYLILK